MNHEERIAFLEDRYLKLEASSIFQTQAIGALLALVDHIGSKPAPGGYNSADLRKEYRRMLLAGTENFLAGISDTNPQLAHELRQVLSVELDKPDK